MTHTCTDIIYWLVFSKNSTHTSPGDPYVKVSDSYFFSQFSKEKFLKDFFFNFKMDSVDILTAISSLHLPMNYYNRTTQQGKLSNIMIKIILKYICLKEKNIY